MRNENHIDSLPRRLATSYEERTMTDSDGNLIETLHPVSFKMCPPNYVMNGIRLLVGKDSQEVVGVSQIQCVPVNDKPIFGTDAQTYGPIEGFQLWADADEEFDDFYMAKSGNKEPFSLEQRIGIPHGPTASTFLDIEDVAVGCEDNKAVVSLKWTRNKDGALIGLTSECAIAPRPTP
jgi:hypothetical protein